MATTFLQSDAANRPHADLHHPGTDVQAPARLLIISHDVVGQRMAGPGIRAWEIACVLAAQQPVTLIAPQPIDRQSQSFACGSYAWGDAASLAVWLRHADVVLANGFVLLGHPELARIAQPLALDLYDPVLLENLELFRTAPEQQRVAQYERDRALLDEQLGAGDFFLCATERQRDLYIGALLLRGRITPAQVDRDRQLRALIDVVPFGLQADPPHKRKAVLRGVLPGIGDDDALLLWTGGLWDWMDPLTLVDAMPRVVEHRPDVRLVFLAGRHPGAVAEMRAPRIARERAFALGLLDRAIFFYDQWVPYEQRADVLLDADVAVSLHHQHLETHYAAVRSRFLDHLWAGLPSLVSDGDAAAELVRTHDLGVVVAPQDVGGVALALCELLDDPQRRAGYAANASRLARQYTWAQTLAPLMRFCRRPTVTRPASARPTQQSSQRAETVMHDEQQPIRQMEQHWQLGTPARQGGLLTRIVERLALRALAPLLAQQREFNAATIKLAYSLFPQIQALDAHRNTLNTQMNALMAQVVALHASIHVLGEFDGDLNDRLTRLIYTVQLLDDAVAEADRVQVDLAAQFATLHDGATDLHYEAGGHE
jgi:glycosyltransferase involved in cell wall biosynthesis